MAHRRPRRGPSPPQTPERDTSGLPVSEGNCLRSTILSARPDEIGRGVCELDPAAAVQVCELELFGVAFTAPFAPASVLLYVPVCIGPANPSSSSEPLVPRGGIEPPTRGFSVPASSLGSPKLAGRQRTKTLSQMLATVNRAGVRSTASTSRRHAPPADPSCSASCDGSRRMKPQRGPPERLVQPATRQRMSSLLPANGLRRLWVELPEGRAERGGGGVDSVRRPDAGAR